MPKSPGFRVHAWQLKYNSGTMNPPHLALLVLTLAALACRPVIAIGWGEVFILALLFLLLFGLPVWRFWKKWRAFQKGNQREKD
ncbi:MAG: hypothetical protein Fur0016_06140 [Anaerolineales bacterium]